MHACRVLSVWEQNGQTSSYDRKEGGANKLDKKSFRLATDDLTLKSEQTSIVVVRFTVAVVCYMYILQMSSIKSTMRVGNPTVRALLSHHYVPSLLYI